MMESYPCGLCFGSDQTHILSQTDKYQQTVSLEVCNRCGLRQLNPRMTDAELERFYASEYYALYSMDEKKFTMPHWVKRKENIAKGILDALEKTRPLKGADLLDVGCGHGFLIKQARERRAVVFGVEPSVKQAGQSRENGFDVFVGDLKQFVEHSHERFDVITLSHVLEHQNWPIDFLMLTSKILKPRGLLCAEVPNTPWQGVYGRHPLSTHSAHLYYFSERTLSATFEVSGLRVLSISYGLDGGTVRAIGTPAVPRELSELELDDPRQVLEETKSAIKRLKREGYRRALGQAIRGVTRIFART